MSKIKKLVEDIIEKKLLNSNSLNEFKNRREYVELKKEFVKAFNDALKNIKPVGIVDLFELFDNTAPWTCYNNFKYKKYFKEVDSKFYQLKKKLEKNNIDLHLEYNMTFNEMWIGCSIHLDESEDGDLFDSELFLDTIFYNEILDKIFYKLNVYPLVLEKCFPIVESNIDIIKMKAWNLNWDT